MREASTTISLFPNTNPPYSPSNSEVATQIIQRPTIRPYTQNPYPQLPLPFSDGSTCRSLDQAGNSHPPAPLNSPNQE